MKVITKTGEFIEGEKIFENNDVIKIRSQWYNAFITKANINEVIE